jgi:hypothetical protein
MFYFTNIIEKRSVCQIVQLRISEMRKIFQPRHENINIDNKTRFSYPEGHFSVEGCFKLFKKKLKNLKAFGDARLAKYFPAVRGAVLLIVIPAFFIVTVYFLNILNEIVLGNKAYDSVLECEKRLASIKKDLPLTAVVNYVSNRKEPDDVINAEYVLIPVRIVRGLKPKHELLVYQASDTAEIPKFEGYTLEKNYGNGVILFKRNE